MPSNLDLKVKATKDTVLVQLAGIDPATVDLARFERAASYRLACLAANRCHSPDQTIQEKLNCAAERGRRRFAIADLKVPETAIKLDVKQAGGGFEIRLAGPAAGALAKALRKDDLKKRIMAELACAAENQCHRVDQPIDKRINCVVRTLERRFKG